MIRKITLLYCLFVVLFGCSAPNDVKHYSQFEQRVSLVAEKVEVPSIMLYPRSLFICGNDLVVFNEKMDTLFQCFQLPELTYRYSFGVKGEGPGDFNLPMIKAVSANRNGFTMVDINKLKHIHRDQDGQFSITTEPLLSEFSYYNGLTKLGDSLYCCDGGFETNEEFLFLYPEKKQQFWGDYPEDKERLGSILARNQAYNKLVVAKPDGSRLAAFYNSVRRYRIYDNRGRLLKDVALDILPGQDMPDAEDENRYIHPISVCATDTYIYTLNLDMTAAEVKERKLNPNIQVFNWEGKPIVQYQLDSFISAMVLDESAHKIYGVFAEEENCIYVFSLPV